MKKSGFTLIEILISLAILGGGVLLFLNVMSQGINNLKFQGKKIQMLNIAASTMDEIKDYSIYDLSQGITLANKDNFSRDLNAYYVDAANFNSPAASPPTDFLRVEVTISDTTTTVSPLTLVEVRSNY